MAGKTVADAVSHFGASAKSKLANVAISGAPEDQLRGPLETLSVTWPKSAACRPMSVISSARRTSLRHQDAPGFRGHRQQRPRRLHRSQGARQGRRPTQVRRSARQGAVGQAQVAAEPALHRRQRVQPVAGRQARRHDRPSRRRRRDIGRQAGSARDAAAADQRFPSLDTDPAEDREAACRRSAPAFAACCATKSSSRWRSAAPALTGLAQDWRKLLFPQADDAQFADGYAQAVTFGLLVARARDISLGARHRSRPRRNCANPTR